MHEVIYFIGCESISKQTTVSKFSSCIIVSPSCYWFQLACCRSTEQSWFDNVVYVEEQLSPESNVSWKGFL